MPKLSPFTTAVASGIDPRRRRAGRRRSPAGRRDGRLGSTCGCSTTRSRTRRRSGSRSTTASVKVEICSWSATTRSCASSGTGRSAATSGSRCEAVGDANLGILQGFFRDVRGSGRAELDGGDRRPAATSRCSPAARRSPTAAPPFLAAELARRDQRRRPLRRARRPPRRCHGDDGRRAGAVRRARRLRRLPAGRAERHRARRGHAPALSRGRALDRRRRPVAARQLQGADARRHGARCRSATWTRRIDPAGGLFDFGGGVGGSERGGRAGGSASRAAAVRRPASSCRRRCTSRTTWSRLVASADLQLRGTYDRPVLFGRAEVDRGEVTVRGPPLPGHARQRSTSPTRRASSRSSTSRRKPDVRVPGPDLPGDRARGRARPSGCSRSSPPIRRCRRPTSLALLFSDVRRNQDVDELRALQNPNERQNDILTTRATQLLADADLVAKSARSSSRPSASTRSSCRRR